MGAVTGAAFGGMAGYANTANWGLAKTVAGQALVGGSTARIQGGSFQSGMLSTAFLAWAGPQIEGIKLTSQFLSRVGRVMATAVVGGTASELGGGKFANGAKSFGFLRAVGEAADYYQDATGRPASLRPGENRPERPTYEPDPNGRQEIYDRNLNVVGNNDLTSFCRQGSVCSKALNLVPLIAPTSVLHDYWFNVPGHPEFTFINNVGTMLPAAAISTGAVLGNFTQGWDSNPAVMFSLTNPRN